MGQGLLGNEGFESVISFISLDCRRRIWLVSKAGKVEARIFVLSSNIYKYTRKLREYS